MARTPEEKAATAIIGLLLLIIIAVLFGALRVVR
jgi:hypothetical protein